MKGQREAVIQQMMLGRKLEIVLVIVMSFTTELFDSSEISSEFAVIWKYSIMITSIHKSLHKMHNPRSARIVQVSYMLPWQHQARRTYIVLDPLVLGQELWGKMYLKILT